MWKRPTVGGEDQPHLLTCHAGVGIPLPDGKDNGGRFGGTVGVPRRCCLPLVCCGPRRCGRTAPTQMAKTMAEDLVGQWGCHAGVASPLCLSALPPPPSRPFFFAFCRLCLPLCLSAAFAPACALGLSMRLCIRSGFGAGVLPLSPPPFPPPFPFPGPRAWGGWSA